MAAENFTDAPKVWFDPQKDCYAVCYLPDGDMLNYALSAYRIISGVFEYIPYNAKTGEVIDTANILIGTVEVRNGQGIKYNEHLFDELREKLAKKREEESAQAVEAS